MSVIDDNDLEEIQEGEEEQEQEADEAGPEIEEGGPEETEQTSQYTITPYVAENAKRNNFAPVNDKRKTNKKANALRFLTTFALNNELTMEQICKYLGITSDTGQKYLREYVTLVIDSIESGRYPDSVLRYYNTNDIPQGQKLLVKYMNDLNPVVARYNDTNIQSMLVHINVDGGQSEPQLQSQQPITPENAIIDDFADSDGSSSSDGGQFKEFNQVKQRQVAKNPTIRTVSANSNIQDIIRFGIHNCGQPDDAKIRKIIAVFMNNPSYYLSDESIFVNLLEANNINAKTITAFMNWFKNVAPISPYQRQGFLALNSTANRIFTQYGPDGRPIQQQQQQGPKNAFNNFNIDDYDEFAQWLYHEGIYKYGLPPNHPINVESYKDYLEEKKQKKQEDQANRQFNMALKQRVLEMQTGRMMGGGMGPHDGQPMPNQGVAFDKQYLIDKGIVVPEISYDMYGRETIRLIPTGKTPTDVYGSGGSGANQQNKPDQFLESVSVVTRLIEALKPALNMGGDSQNPLMNKFMEAAIGKLINKAEESPVQALDAQLGLFTKLQQAFPQTGGGNRPKTDSELQTEIRLQEIENDKFFAEKEIALKKEDIELKRSMMQKQEEDSKNGIEMILSWIGKGFEVITPMLNNVLMGNMGGGIGNILGGMMPGGGGGGGSAMGPGGMMGTPNIPQQPQPNEFEVVEPNNYVPGPEVMPQEFLPQQPGPEAYYPQQQQQQTSMDGFVMPQQQPQQYQQYQPQPQQQYQQPPPEYQEYGVPQQEPQNEDDFLDTVTINDLDSLTLGQLDEITNRIENKATKIEKLLNSIKTTKTRKQFGYNKPIAKPIVTTQDILKIPDNINPNYDGVSNQREVEPTIIDPQRAQEEEYIVVEDTQPTTFINYYDNDIYMGNDSQQFNQQNDANQPEYIEKVKKVQAAENLKAENARRVARGEAPLPDGTVVDERGQVVSEDSLKASDNKFENSDKYNDNPGLNEDESASSEEFNKQHKAGKSQKANESKGYDSEDAAKEKAKKGNADTKYDNTKAKNK